MLPDDITPHLSLFSLPESAPAPRPERKPAIAGKPSIAERFADFDARHPEIWAAYVRFSREVYQSKAKEDRCMVRYGIAAITERIRWHYMVERDSAEPFKVNNNFRSLYARKLVKTFPEMGAMFTLRNLRAA